MEHTSPSLFLQSLSLIRTHFPRHPLDSQNSYFQIAGYIQQSKCK